jgi:hypothetical protein
MDMLISILALKKYTYSNVSAGGEDEGELDRSRRGAEADTEELKCRPSTV